MQPGKPQGFGLIGEDKIPIIMVPGNPVSTFVSFEAFVRPVIRKLMGVEPYARTPVRCSAGAEIRSTPGKTQFVRAEVVTHADGQRTAAAIGGHSSHLLGNLARSNGLIIVDEATEVVRAGSPVSVWLLTEDE